MKPPTVASEKVPFITKLAFGAGDVGPAVVTAIMSFYFLYFLTDVARLNPVTAGLVWSISKIWDAVNDPIIGLISDRTQTRWGRRRPWFLFGAIPFGLSFFLLFLVPALGDLGKALYYLVILLMLDTAFTVVNVPYTALTPELTNDYDERTSLNSYRFAFSIGGSLIAAVGHQIIVDALKPAWGEQAAYTGSVLVWSIVGSVPFVFAFWGTYERHTHTEMKELSLLDSLKITFGNRAFRYVISIYLLSWVVVQTVSTIIIFYLTYWLRKPHLISLTILCVQGSALLWLFIWSRVSQSIGKKGVYYRGMIFWIFVSLALFAVQPEWGDGVILLLAALAGVGVATAYLVPWAMLPDVIELDELETGERREGAFYGFFVLLQKSGLAFAALLVGWMLDAAGYVTPPPDALAPIQQPASALLAIRWMVGPVPAIILALSLWLVYRFPITKEQHARTLAELAKRKQAAQPPL
jgi:GPH family glycoside/pentoside/hexuronide:cation symporter